MGIVVLAGLTGCHHHVKVAALPPPALPPEMVSVPPPTHPSEPLPALPLAKVEPITPEIPRQKKLRLKTTPAPVPPPVSPTVAAAASEPVRLGQLTTGSEADDPSVRQQTEELLHQQQKRLADISGAVQALHAQQIEQARLFLRQADEAWKKLDVEGTRTLATKAKVLLDEILS